MFVWCLFPRLRYLYNQLAEFRQNPDSTILAETSPGRFRVRPGVTFHLYISTAPCGDGAQFSRTDAGENAEGPEGLEFTGHAQHLPTFGKNIQGLLRTKMEYGRYCSHITQAVSESHRLSSRPNPTFPTLSWVLYHPTFPTVLSFLPFYFFFLLFLVFTIPLSLLFC